MTLFNVEKQKLETSFFVKSLESYPDIIKSQIIQEVKMAIFVACNLKDDFTGSELFKGTWGDLSLELIYKYHISQGRDDKSAQEQSASDIGKILKKVLVEHKLEFELIGNNGRGRFNPNIYKLKK